MKRGVEYITDGTVCGASDGMFALYCHAVNWIRLVDGLLTEGVCQGVAEVIADAGYTNREYIY